MTINIQLKRFRHLYRIPEFISILIVCWLIIVLPWFQRGELYKDYIYDKVFFFFMATGFLLVLNGLMLFSSHRKFHRAFPDIFVLVFVTYLFLNRYFVSHTEGITVKHLQVLTLAIVYFLLRSYSAKYYKFFLYSIILSGLAQSIYGILQLYGLYPSKHHLFNITGSFFNPGPYAGYLSIVLPIALALWLQDRKSAYRNNLAPTLQGKILASIKSLVPPATVIAVLLVLPATRSRAAWLAALFSCAFVLNYFYPVRSVLSPFRKQGLKKFLTVSILLVLVSGAISGIYIMKKGSADGRLFIWKTSCQLVKEKPVFGHGHEKFQAFYMEGQAGYFKNNPESSYAAVADDISYPFNEYIKTLVELGVAGFAIMAAMAFFLFRTGKKAGLPKNQAEPHGSSTVRTPTSNPRYPVHYFPLLRRCIPESQLLTTHHSPLLTHHSPLLTRHSSLLPRAGILAFLVFSFFSYPSEILPIMLNLVVLIAVTVGMMQFKAFDYPVSVSFVSGWRSSVLKTVIGLGTLFLIVIAAAPVRNLYKAYYSWDEGHKIYQMGMYVESLESFEEAYPVLNNNGEFLIMYGKALSMAEKYGKAIQVLQETCNYQKNTILYNALGDSYKATGEFKKAESAYLKAYYMLPGRFYSKYLLAILYRETGQKEKALATALELMEKEVKVPSMAIEEIRMEMQKLILGQGDDQ